MCDADGLNRTKFTKTHTDEEEKMLLEYLRIKKGENVDKRSYWTDFLMRISQQRQDSAIIIYSAIYFIIVCPSTIYFNFGIFQFVVAYFVSDFISGLTHIYFDHSKVRYNDDFIDLNRIGTQIHHVYPNFDWIVDKTYEPYYEAVTLFPTILFLTLVNRCLFGNLIVYYVLFLGLWAQPFHYYSHAIIHDEHVPFVVRKLQNIGLVIRPSGHKRHHSTFDNNYCVLSGWCNPILNVFTQNESLLNGFVNFVDKIC